MKMKPSMDELSTIEEAFGMNELSTMQGSLFYHFDSIGSKYPKGGSP